MGMTWGLSSVRGPNQLDLTPHTGQTPAKRVDQNCCHTGHHRDHGPDGVQESGHGDGYADPIEGGREDGVLDGLGLDWQVDPIASVSTTPVTL